MAKVHHQAQTRLAAAPAAEGWSLSGELGGPDEGDPALVFHQDRPRPAD